MLRYIRLMFRAYFACILSFATLNRDCLQSSNFELNLGPPIKQLHKHDHPVIFAELNNLTHKPVKYAAAHGGGLSALKWRIGFPDHAVDLACL